MTPPPGPARCPILRRRRRGLSIVELSIGMSVTAVVMAALSAIWFAVARAWTTTADGQSVVLIATQAGGRIEATCRQAKYVCQYTSGSAAGTAVTPGSVLLWASDNWLGTADRQPQLAELVLIEHDANNKRLCLYKPLAYASMTASQRTRAAGVATWAELSDPGMPATFRALDFVQKLPIAPDVTGLAFNLPTTSTGARQTVEFTLAVTRTDGSHVVYGAAALRSPTTRPRY